MAIGLEDSHRATECPTLCDAVRKMTLLVDVCLYVPARIALRQRSGASLVALRFRQRCKGTHLRRC